MRDETKSHPARPTPLFVFHGRETDYPLRAYVGKHCTIADDLTDEYDAKYLVTFADGFTGIAFADELVPHNARLERPPDHVIGFFQRLHGV